MKDWGVKLSETPGALEKKRIELTQRARKHADPAIAEAQRKMMKRTEGRRKASRHARARPKGYQTAKPGQAMPTLRQAIEKAWDKETD